MNIATVTREMSSSALKEIVESVSSIVDDAQVGQITYRQAMVEITANKHILQAFIFDKMLTLKHQQNQVKVA